MVGKTTLAKKIANHFNIIHIDTDEYIQKTHLSTIQDLFLLHEEPSFRFLEHQSLIQILSQYKNSHFILSCGGGLPCFYNNIQHLIAQTYVMYLNAPLSFFEWQLKNNPEWKNRPLLNQNQNNPLQVIQDLLKQREPYYQQAHYVQQVYKEIEQTYQDLVHHIQNKFVH